MEPDIEDVDLAALAAALRQAFEGSSPVGYVRGRTGLRDAVVAHLGCSEAEAERLVETMISNGFLHYQGDPAEVDESDAIWTIESSP